MADRPLSKKHQVFINEYLKTFNATQAYLRVYPKSTYDSATANASRLIASDRVKNELRRRLDEMQMSADEALKRLSEHARGDLGDFLEIKEMGHHIDLAKAERLGLMHLVKKVKQKTITINSKNGDDKEIFQEELELHDPQAALRDILRVHGKLTNHMDITSKGERIGWKEFISSDIEPESDKI